MLFIKLLLAHVITDFVTQTEKFIERKRRSKMWLLLHAVIFVILSFLLLFDEKSDWRIMAAIVGLGMAHYLVDLIKINLRKEKLASFMLDQAAHIFLILLVYLFFDLTGSYLNILNIIHALISSPKPLIILLSLFIITSTGSVLIDKIISKFKSRISENKIGIESAGKYIGIIERLLIFIFIFTGYSIFLMLPGPVIFWFISGFPI
ncbi:MAG: DUF3307 domain-containing protein [Actinobacteria bacterium]|nr:DUF3307 domain-containing protein [Actinomycetota bacterium]